MKKMPINKVLPIIIALIVVGGGAFYSGMKYAESKISSGNFSQVDFQNFRNLSPEERQQRLTNSGGNRARNGQMGTNFFNGEIISKDDKSVTIKLKDGGSKIVFFSDSTQIMKTTEGLKEDLKVGENLSVSGDANQDGSITAKSIQLRRGIAGQ